MGGAPTPNGGSLGILSSPSPLAVGEILRPRCHRRAAKWTNWKPATRGRQSQEARALQWGGHGERTCPKAIHTFANITIHFHKARQQARKKRESGRQTIQGEQTTPTHPDPPEPTRTHPNNYKGGACFIPHLPDIVSQSLLVGESNGVLKRTPGWLPVATSKSNMHLCDVSGKAVGDQMVMHGVQGFCFVMFLECIVCPW